MNIPIALLSGIVGVIFTAGVAWTQLKGIRKDLNGLGAKSNWLNDQQVRAIVTQLVVTESRRDREMLAKPILDR